MTASSEAVLGAVAPLLLPYLERQRWYRAARRAAAPAGPAGRQLLQVATSEVLRDGPQEGPGLARLVLVGGTLRLQVVVGWREAADASAVLHGREAAILGAASVPEVGEVLVYDALADEELLRTLLAVVSRGAQSARRARLVESLTSHASVVYDDRLFMKLYRVLEPPPRPEVEVMVRLDEVGFNYIVAPVAVWRTEEGDLALVREFWAGGVEGRALALTSLRDLLGEEPDELAEDADRAAARAGGDLASEMRRLGEMTARLHVAMAAAFGEQPASFAGLVDAVAGAGGAEGAALAERVRAVPDSGAGRTIRVHGDYHLRRVLRTDAGWMVAGFGDDPTRAPGLGASATPLHDVADLGLAVDEVAAEASARHHEAARSRDLAGAWARRNRSAFLDGYLAVPDVAPLLPAARADVETVLAALTAVRARRAGA